MYRGPEPRIGHQCSFSSYSYSLLEPVTTASILARMYEHNKFYHGESRLRQQRRIMTNTIIVQASNTYLTQSNISIVACMMLITIYLRGLLCLPPTLFVWMYAVVCVSLAMSIRLVVESLLQLRAHVGFQLIHTLAYIDIDSIGIEMWELSYRKASLSPSVSLCRLAMILITASRRRLSRSGWRGRETRCTHMSIASDFLLEPFTTWPTTITLVRETRRLPHPLSYLS